MIGEAVFSLLLCAACAGLGLLEVRRTGMLLTPWTLFLGLCILDVFFPAAVFFVVGLGVQAPWISGTLMDVLPRAVLFFTAGVALFGFTYHLVDEMPRDPQSEDGTNEFPRVRVGMALFLFVCAVALQGTALRSAVAEAGSVGEWARFALTNRFRSDQGADIGLFGRIASMLTLPLLFVSTGVVFLARARHRILFGWLVPGIALVMCALTLFRGTVLALFIGLALVSRFGRQQIGAGPTEANRNHSSNRIVVLGLILFMGATIIRTQLTMWAWESVTAERLTTTEKIAQLARGETLVGVASIMETYGQKTDYLGGKTIIDMLLLPIPRSIYTSKPTWYGIDDITRGMGWPPSTQSAVGMPGELFANFGYPGLVGMLVFGALFGFFRHFENRPRAGIVYAFVLVPAMFPTFWMATTGLVNQLSMLPVFMLAMWLTLPGSDVISRSQAPSLEPAT